ncbi:prepilin-type N-terminal cleavage/methylation domain-containing protein [Puniceicoccales bacterium CK1056]|uniref:Prepilin-type N-terminal cleavage/methylation domain-containing protein n=1 Tax=Oceanipulchritudo coccoides TaxID=2706888 RepID=A0A6B2M3W3_9BACT|nr:prepilin-type N-terminal cleavage/methylation domain-containing protein [Oceanipulchritudo coccoides]NDV62505.1 prepilin-type N-terminal cleavage/methylation domain-containing protein [Oceanipulchritudo coccoides]
MKTLHRSNQSGLTLIEMIVTIGIIATFMTLLSFHLFALSNLWLNRTDDDFFDQHVDGVVLFLNNAFEASESTPASGDQEQQMPVEWARPPGWSEFDDPLLHFRQAEAPALFVREGRPLPAIMAYIHFEEDTGLSILWYSAFDAEEIEEVRDLKRTPVSSFVSKIEYAYYELEDDEWEITEQPIEEDDDIFLLPNYLRLTFSYPDEDDRIRSIFVPQKSLELPLF